MSPGTVALAFRTLRERGVITTAHGRRARIAERPPLPSAGALPLPRGVRDLSTASPDPALLPDLGRFFDRGMYEKNLYNSDIVEPTLHEIMAAQFHHDALDGTLTATHGALDALERILAGIARPGDAVVVEDPLWVSSLGLLRMLGLVVIPVAVDDEGLKPDQLDAALRSRHCTAVILTPRAQNPYGSAMTRPRAAQLQAVLDGFPGVLVIEDDHANLIAGTPAVTTTHGRDRWAVIRSVSKAIGPDLRFAVVVSDPETADAVQGRIVVGPGWVSHLIQRIVARALTDPQTLDDIALAERRYAERREALISGLAAVGIPAIGRSGMNVLIPVREEAATVAHLMADGWGVRPGEPFRLGTPPFVRVTISTLQPHEIPELVDSFVRVLQTRAPRRNG